MKKNNKYIFYLLLSIIVIYTILSYKGYLFFSSGFNNFDYLIFNILGDTILVGIVTHISSKNISTYISKKEFERNNKINISINEARNEILDYEMFMDIYKNDEVLFALNQEEQNILKYVYNLYDHFLKVLLCSGIEKQLLDIILNIPFFIEYYEDDDVEKVYYDIMKKINLDKKFVNIFILKKMLKKEDIKKLKKFSHIISNLKHYKITNLNNNEGNNLLVNSNNIVSCKISCLPNHTYDIYMYFKKECMIDFLAFSYDYNLKEYYTNLYSFKYTNDSNQRKQIKINLSDYVKYK